MHVETREGMMKWLGGMALAAALVMIAPVAHAQTAAVDTKADLQKTATDWMNAYNNKDAAAIAGMYVDDAVFSNPGWTASGRAAIEDGLKKDKASVATSCGRLAVPV
jgi:SnoaL-like protein